MGSKDGARETFPFPGQPEDKLVHLYAVTARRAK